MSDVYGELDDGIDLVDDMDGGDGDFDFIDPVAALTTRTAIARDVEHQTTMRVWIDKVKGIVLPTVTSYTFTQDELNAIHAAHELVITDKATQAHGWDVLKALKTSRRAVTSWYETLRKPFNEIAKAIIGLEDRDAEPVTDAEHILGFKLKAYDDEAARLDAIERQRLQEEADAQARAEQLRAAAALQRVADIESDPGVKTALTSEAAAIAAAPVAAPSVQITSRRAVSRGAGFTVRWTGEVLDRMKFIKAVATGRIPLDAVEIRQEWVDSKARELHEQLGVVYPFLKVIKHDGTRG